MKQLANHFKREAWIMALILSTIILLGVIAGIALPWLRRTAGWQLH